MISSEVWGEVDGGPVNLWHLTTDTAIGPMRIAVADYGATLQTFVVPDATGIATDIVLGYDTLGEYIAGDAYFGAIAGRSRSYETRNDAFESDPRRSTDWRFANLSLSTLRR